MVIKGNERRKLHSICIAQVEEIMSFIIAVALISVWISATSGITLPPISGPSPKPSPYIVTTVNVWRDDTTCEIIFNTDPSNPTGYYLKLNAGKLTVDVMYCDMDQIGPKPKKNKNMRLCGKDGPWIRIGYLNMGESFQNCPSNWEEYTTGRIRTCQRKSSGPSCDSVIIPSNGKQYTEICGRVVGYQYGKTTTVYSHPQDINSYYVDGVSITRGTPRQHVWTLMAGINENIDTSYGPYYQCPCRTGGSNFNVQSFIGNDWYCESGSTDEVMNIFQRPRSYMSDPLWDGKSCPNDESPCCAQKQGQPAPQPWFHKVIPSGTKDDLEIRICDQVDKFSADVLVTMYELYIK